MRGHSSHTMRCGCCGSCDRLTSSSAKPHKQSAAKLNPLSPAKQRADRGTWKNAISLPKMRTVPCDAVSINLIVLQQCACVTMALPLDETHLLAILNGFIEVNASAGGFAGGCALYTAARPVAAAAAHPMDAPSSAEHPTRPTCLLVRRHVQLKGGGGPTAPSAPPTAWTLLEARLLVPRQLENAQ